MDKKEKLYNTWAMADKSLIDRAKKNQRLSSTLNNKDSSDESSDPDSDSNNDFIALPAEFRPNLKQRPQKQTKDGTISLKQAVKDQTIQSPTSAPEKSTYNSPEKRSLSTNRNQVLSLQNNVENSSNNESSVLKVRSQSKIRYQIVKQDNHPEAKGKSSDETSENYAKAKKISRQKVNLVKDFDLPGQQRALSLADEHKNKKSLKYEHVQTKEVRTIQLNFDNLSFKDNDLIFKEGLKYETRLAQNTHTNHRNDNLGENRITKRKTKKRSNLSDGHFTVSSEQNTVKWDSSLNLNEDNKIEWTVIREETSMTVSRTVTSSQFNKELNSEDYHINRVTMKNSHSKILNNPVQKEASNNEHTNPKAIRKSNLVHKKPSNNKNVELENSFLSKVDNNLNYTHIRYPDSTSDSDSSGTKECICCKQQSATKMQNVENVTSSNSPNEPLVFGSVKSKIDYPRKNPLTASNTEQNAFSQLQQVKKDLKLSSGLNFQNSSCESSNLAPVQNNNGDHNNQRKKPLSIENKDQNGFSQLQQIEKDLKLPPGPNVTRTENLNVKLSKGLEDKKESILRYGKEASDLIIGSYDALNMFISFYREWEIARKELIAHFKQLKEQLKESSKKFSKFKDILQIANSGAAVATAIPHPATSMAAKIVTAITSLLQTFLSNKTDKSNVEDSDETARAVLKDNRTSSDLYMYGLQCSQQFEETTKIIEEFHSNADIQGFFDNESPEITIFLRDFLEFKPNHRIFYKKLHKCFQELLHTNNTYFSRKFCEPFTLYSISAVDVIGHLRWRFRHEDFDSSSVRHELEEIQRLIQNSNSISLDDLQKRIQSCIAILTDELEFLENRMKDIAVFDSSLDYKTV